MAPLLNSLMLETLNDIEHMQYKCKFLLNTVWTWEMEGNVHLIKYAVTEK